MTLTVIVFFYPDLRVSGPHVPVPFCDALEDLYIPSSALRSVFLASMGAEEIQIQASFGAAIRIARAQKSVSLEKRAEATYAEYRRQKANASGGRGIRLPLW